MPARQRRRLKIEVLRCPAHGFMAVAINDYRVTSGKCCGSWETIKTWKTTESAFEKDLERALKQAR